MDTFANISLIDARPFLPAASNTPWALAEKQRDDFATAIEAALKARGIVALVLKSQPGVYPISLSITAWTPEADRDAAIDLRREWLTISMEVNPYLVKPLIYHLKVHTTRAEHAAEVYDMTEKDAVALAMFALGFGPHPNILPAAFEQMVTQFLESLPFVPKRNPLIMEARPTPFTAPSLLAYAAVLIIVFTFMFKWNPVVPSLLAIGSFIGARVIMSQRTLGYSIVKRPELAPRALLLVDSWHTSVPGVGAHFENLVARVERAVSMLDPNIRTAWETHHYRTPYGFEDRRRLALTKDQAVVHIHLYPFADDAFVGWDGFLNRACWAETTPLSIAVRGTHKVEYRSLTVAPYAPTEVDLVELNALSELVHRRVVIELKAFMKEQQIEADIDFSIIRGDRSGYTSGDEPSKGRGGWRALKAAARA
jgi:hypothetical protein